MRCWYLGRSGLIALLHRLGMEHRKPKAISRKLDPVKQQVFIAKYEALLDQLPANEARDLRRCGASDHAARPLRRWAPKDMQLAVPQTSGRERMNVHGAIDLETGNTRMLEVATVNAVSTIMLLMAIEAMYPDKAMIHEFLDNAQFIASNLVQRWLAQPGRRIKLHFIPVYRPRLHPIERLWGLMHRPRPTSYATPVPRFNAAVLGFLPCTVPRNWRAFCARCHRYHALLQSGGFSASRLRITNFSFQFQASLPPRTAGRHPPPPAPCRCVPAAPRVPVMPDHRPLASSPRLAREPVARYCGQPDNNQRHRPPGRPHPVADGSHRRRAAGDSAGGVRTRSRPVRTA